MDILEGLNPEQIDAVTTTEGYVRVIAGAGSGKTRALSHRFAYLVNEIGIMPGNILCVTFTNKSTNEMKQRIRRLTGDNDTGYISTFHGFCVSVLQEESNAVAYPKSFLVLDNSDIDAMLRLIYEERGLTLRHMTFANARDMIEIRKGSKNPDYYLDMIAMSPDELKKKYDESVSAEDIIFYGYLYQEKKCFGLDYNDLIKFTLYIFRENEEIRQKWQQRLEYIMIDEYQDIDELQYALMKVLCAYHNNLFIVGDPDQTIYTWRGARVQYILDFDKEFKNVKTIMMMRNYRSTPEVIACANSLISHNKQRINKDLLPTLPPGDAVVYHHAATAEEEAKWIAREIKALAAAGAKLSDIALLYRAHYVTRTVEEVFLKEELPYRIYSGVQFFARAEIKDALSYLRLVAFKDDLSFLRVANNPKRNIGERRRRFLQAYAAEHACTLYEAFTCSLEDEVFRNTGAKKFAALIERFSACCHDMPISELLAALLDQSGYEEALRTEGSQERLDNLAELRQSVYEYETTCGEESTLENYLSHVAMLTNLDADAGGNAVKMMTVHSAKGLEFPYVFLIAMEEGVFPSRKVATIEGMEEERRLAFVAMTRAEKRLYLSGSQGKNLDGSFRYPSRFVLDIDKSLVHYDVELPESLVNEAKYRAKSADKLREISSDGPPHAVGDRVRHPVMGAGQITALDEVNCAYVIQFEEIPTPRKISFRAKLERG